MASIELQDSRRLTGPNLVADGPGAVIDGTLEGVEPKRFRDLWRARIREVLEAVGWASEASTDRIYRGGVTVFHSAPVDSLYAATEVNEWAWVTAAAAVGADTDPEPIGKARDRLRALIDEESNPRLIALQAAAVEHGVTFLTDDDEASVGTGTGTVTWPIDALPDAADVPWGDVHDVPRVLVTGTNGKTTTVRMIDAIGRLADLSSSVAVLASKTSISKLKVTPASGWFASTMTWSPSTSTIFTTSCPAPDPICRIIPTANDSTSRSNISRFTVLTNARCLCP